MQSDRTAVVIALDTRAPGTARDFVVQCLEQRVVAPALDSAQLLVSELVTNSLRHSGAAMDEVVVSVELMPDWLRIGVQDSGSDAVIAAEPADLVTGDGFGLNLVQMLSERWGVERLAGGGTQVWAQLARAGGVSAGGANGNGSGRLAIRAA
jgi:serine/threonine-protein kinase RsbW